MSVDLGLKKIASLILDKKNFLLKLLDTNELINKVKIESILLLNKIKNLELELSVAREQTNKSASSKLDHMLSVQKFPQTNLVQVLQIASWCLKLIPQTLFLLLSPPRVRLSNQQNPQNPRKIRIDLKEFKPKNPNLPKDKLHDKPLWVCHFCGKIGHIHPNYFKLQAAKQAKKPKVLVPQAQDPMVLIGELVKTLNLYTNPGVAHHSNMSNKSNARVVFKKFWIQKAQSN